MSTSLAQALFVFKEKMRYGNETELIRVSRSVARTR